MRALEVARVALILGTLVLVCLTANMALKPGRRDVVGRNSNALLGDRTYKCGLSKACPQGHFVFKIQTGSANIIGPTICFEDKVLLRSTLNNVAVGLNIALVDDINNALKFLQDIDERTLVLVASFDNMGTVMNDELKQLFTKLGSSYVNSIGYRDNWIFIGSKGINGKSQFEEYMKNVKETNLYEDWPKTLLLNGCIPANSTSATASGF
ncbi:protein FAM3D-like isoform X2 [Acipenser ruthenus]|uniref:protein FAM3D-like isoform X2 n=1 Tax=Acipenser ruthenus TaxID=7906 RepID=UPI00145AAB0F|nr:protein FAM3D-like isoform X2 [Acipenser ruthenus]